MCGSVNFSLLSKIPVLQEVHLLLRLAHHPLEREEEALQVLRGDVLGETEIYTQSILTLKNYT